VSQFTSKRRVEYNFDLQPKATGGICIFPVFLMS